MSVFKQLVALAVVAGATVVPPVAHAQVTETVLYNFTGGRDGAAPAGTLLADTTGRAHAARTVWHGQLWRTP
jgi:hypothetical protein